MSQEKDFDYIITGAGCAGLSILMRMMEDPFFSDKQILIVDQDQKNKNDRTWCFWESEPGLFEPIVHHQWERIGFYSDAFSSHFDLYPYSYKMIRGIDFYRYVTDKISEHPNIKFRQEKILDIQHEDDVAVVQLDSGKCRASYVLNSIRLDTIEKGASAKSGYYYFLQHFKGWLIHTEQPQFDPSNATFMDFRISQEHGTTFMYVLPLTTNVALIEYTLFTPNVLPDEAYDAALRAYIQDKLGIDHYQIDHVETGIIPMTNQPFPLQNGRIIQVGIAGGQAKGSTGYAFRFIQKRADEIIVGLKQGHHRFDQSSFTQRKGRLYDSVLLQVLQHQKMPGHQIFTDIFRSGQIRQIFRFLDNESNLLEDLQIMSSVPTSIFLPAALRELTGIRSVL